MVTRGFTKILAPQDSLESMKGFLTWMVLEEQRALEFETMTRQAAGYLSATGRPALMADRSVKALVKELNDSHGTSRQPMTIGTKLMLGHSTHDIIPRFWAKLPLIACRNSVNLINEAIGALRVAESCNGGSEG